MQRGAKVKLTLIVVMLATPMPGVAVYRVLEPGISHVERSAGESRELFV